MDVDVVVDNSVAKGEASAMDALIERQKEFIETKKSKSKADKKGEGDGGGVGDEDDATNTNTNTNTKTEAKSDADSVDGVRSAAPGNTKE